MTSVRVGDIDLTIVSDGKLLMNPGSMFGPNQPEEWRAMVHLEDGKVPFSVNCLVIRSAGRTILLDTGVGSDEAEFIERYGGQCGHLVDNLRAAGVQPDEIDTVIVSHAHADHVGGATKLVGEAISPTFPRATYWLWQAEWDHWTTPESLAARPFLQRKLTPLADQGRLRLAEQELDVAPGVRLISAPGHTPGHVCVGIASGQEMAVYVGDLIHHAAQCTHPEWCPAFDLLPEQSAASRRRILEEARRNNAMVLTAHLAAPGIARPSGSGWELPSG